ncbi:uncharacterized protein LOC127245042 [Andrographis paniculata]|uniref:uncharacterized protein LOC127245042 n=1 Tax=Andrographis paniculata TaxID=175694 RepID=UPI0021E7CF39|nr:uncharacterized protein LOC127245042 [Andrographis paniculata]
MESVLEKYRNPNIPVDDYTRLIEAYTRERIKQLNQQLDEILDAKNQLMETEKRLDEMDTTRSKGWWEEIPVESLDGNQINEWIVWFENVLTIVKDRRSKMIENGERGDINGGGSSSQV